MNSSGSKFNHIALKAGVGFTLFIVAAAIVLAIGLNGRGTRAFAPSTNLPAELPATTGATEMARMSYSPIVSRVAPAVVTILSEGHVEAPQQQPSFGNPFGGEEEQEQQAPRRRMGLGSGVIVSSDGYILTNNHVIAGAEKIKVQLTDNRAFDGKVVGSDAPSDLAVVKIEANGLPVLPLGNSDDVRVGDVALAVGNPLGVGQTVTSGIISAKGRQTGSSDGSYEDFLQTDAPINQGNSGGALVNTNGELIGINSQILSPSGGNIGIGFAIPSNMAKGVMDQLIKSGNVRRGVLGVTVQPITSDIAASLGLKDMNGVIVNSVMPGGSAEKAGLKQGDVITKLNGVAVTDSNAFRNHVASTQPGTTVTLTVLRNGREQELSATLAERPGTASASSDAQAGPTGGKLGVSVEPLTPELAAQLRLDASTKGLVVRDLDPEGPAAEAGIQRGDVIVEFNRQPVSSVDQLRAAMQDASGHPVLMLVNRNGNNVFVTVRLR
ncbi:MAG TPA: DegQ family serine endoprotease [Pyrinomonadaceae bacterium]|nr:DegQ family serine endoprotease [Pyrinomonadaceae bacterium]